MEDYDIFTFLGICRRIVEINVTLNAVTSCPKIEYFRTNPMKEEILLLPIEFTTCRMRLMLQCGVYFVVPVVS